MKRFDCNGCSPASQVAQTLKNDVLLPSLPEVAVAGWKIVRIGDVQEREVLKNEPAKKRRQRLIDPNGIRGVRDSIRFLHMRDAGRLSFSDGLAQTLEPTFGVDESGELFDGLKKDESKFQRARQVKVEAVRVRGKAALTSMMFLFQSRR